MGVDEMELVTALLALVAGVVAIAAAALCVGARSAAVAVGGDWWLALRRAALWLAWLIAAAAMAGSLYFSEVADYTPCRLCWYQRIAMYALAVILLVAAIRRDRTVAWYVVPLAGLGAVVSVYHSAVEWRPSLEAACDPFNPCSIVWFRRFGFVTLPFMALCGFLAVVALTLLAARETEAA